MYYNADRMLSKLCVMALCMVTLSYRNAFSQSKLSADSVKGLKDYYQDYFPIGVAVKPQSLQGAEATLILKQFNSLTPENAMKMGVIHPDENRYNWKGADEIVAFAQEHHLLVRGHNLCWHNQTPDWIFKDSIGNVVTKAILLRRLKEHITEVVGRYKGKIYAWDVVNEAIGDDRHTFLRESPWYKICGDEFIAKAFEYAHAADSEAKLFYNDYDTEIPHKRDRIYALMKQLLEAHVPVHGIGLQAHWSLYDPSEEALKQSIEKFSSLGLIVQITELDISVYRPEGTSRVRNPGESDRYTPLMQQKQAEQYGMAFRIFRQYKKEILGVTFWNVSDRDTWLDNFPVRGRKNYPLLFDQNFKPKKVYWDVVKF